ncbi:signal recognition particle, SRP19 subunit [Syncephalis plumigaleata]|nr:signal recognition particle, SRP19 subunit [Syncephalis plumigaleata]
MDDIDVDDMDYALSTVDDQVHQVEGYGNVRYVESDELFKDWVCLYPIYFDADRSLEHGRKVPKSLAYPKPDARAIVEASKQLRLMVAFEPHKMHPRDFGVLGRVRVQLKVDGRPANQAVPNRKTLMRKVGALLPEIQPTLPPAPSNVPPEWAALNEAFGGASASTSTSKAHADESSATTTTDTATSTSKSAKKKKGKKGRR